MNLRVSVGLFATVAPMALSASPVWAQDAAVPASPATAAAGTPSSVDAEAIVVTGVRQSLRASIDTKRNSDLIQDSISNEDVGKFPTRNIADALQRITGVQVNRNYGEGSTILLRGLPSNMVANMYNGRQLPSPTGGRSLDYSILPVDFVKTLSIYKSPTADLPQTGLAGTVNVEPIRPLELKKDQTFALNLDGVHDGNTKKIKGGVSAFYAGKFLNDTLGIALGFSKSTRSISRTGWSDFWFEPRKEIPPGGAAVPGGNKFYPNGFDPNGNGVYTDTYRLWHYAQVMENVGTRDRTSFVGNLQWKPSDKFELNGDLILSRMRTRAQTIGASARFTNALGAFSNVKTDAYNNIISADVDNTWLLYTARDDDSRQRLGSGSLGFKWKPTERLEIAAGGSKGSARQTGSNFSLEGTTYTKMHYDFLKDPHVASFSYADPNFKPMDPNSWYYDHINGNYNATSNNDTYEWHFNSKYQTDLGPLKSIYFGGNITSNRFYGDGQNLNVGLKALSAITGQPIIANAYPDGRSALSAAPYMAMSPISGNPISSYTGGATYPNQFLWSDSSKFFAKYSLSSLLASPGALSRNPAVASRVRELVDAAYLRLNFASDDNRFSANIGLRYEWTKADSTFYGVDFTKILYDDRPTCDQVCAQSNLTLNATQLKTQTSKYGQWLPSVNLKFSVTDKLIARISASKEMTRPDLNVLIGGESVQMNQTPATGGAPLTTINSGNPDIKPYLANALDASLEWYFSREGLLSAAFFYKDVSNWVFTSQTNETHTIALVEGGSKDYSFLRTLPQNGGGVKIKGFELSYQQPFTFLPGALSGFGFIGNYTYVDASDIINKATGERLPVVGVSKNSFNASLYYEKYGFNARLSYNYHQGRIEQVRDYWSVGPTYSRSYGQFDLSTGYQINEHAQLTFSVINLTNKPNYVGYAKTTGYINDYYQEGRIMQAGLHLTL